MIIGVYIEVDIVMFVLKNGFEKDIKVLILILPLVCTV